MTEMTLTIEDPKDASLIRKLLSKFNGVTIKTTRRNRNGLESAWKDVEAGRVTRYDSVEDFFKEMGV